MDTTLFETGQIWRVEGRTATPILHVALHRLNDLPGIGLVACASLTPQSDKDAGFPVVGHIPILLETAGLDEAHLIADGAQETDSFTEGYEAWKEAFDRHEAGLFTITVAEVYELLCSQVGTAAQGDTE